MKKFLLCVIALVCVSIGAWAEDYTGESKTWTSCDNSSVQETAFIFTINTPGKLSEAKASTQSTYEIVKIIGELNRDDIATLSTFTAATMDLQDAYYMENGERKAFIFTNSSVRNLILPDNWTKAEVNAAAQTVNANLGSAISLGTFKDADGSVFASESSYANKTAITAYVNTSKTLRDALIRTYSEGSNTKFGSGGFNQSTLDWSYIYGITISGNAVAQDFSKASLDFTEEGHLVFNREANEKERNKAKDARTIVGTGSSKVPAFSCNTLGPDRVVSLDLSGVIIDDANNSDLTLGEMDIVGAATRQVCIPTCSSLKTLPADFLNVNGIGVNQICIPGNIQVIKTRAFQNVRLDHVWTTGNAEDIRYDNGIYVRESGEEVAHEGYLSYDAPTFNLYENVYTYYLYGTYTLPENLKLIESNAFCYERDARIKDVYSLAIQTPECHVDAFSTINYTGNNTFDASSVTTEGIVTREAYIQDRKKYNFITMLHYPRECGTPYIQRYTDPTREYSIATGEVDGKGSTIYFPNQNEFLRAYSQGTYGYVWNAWDPTRSTNGSNEIANIKSENPYTQAGQIQANNLYTSNNVFTAKSDRTFYDTTDGGNVEKPAGQGNYWDVEWEGQQLYPQAVSTTPNPSYVYVRDDNGDYVLEMTTTGTAPNFTNSLQFREYTGSADDALERYSRKQDIGYYSCPDGHFVQDYSWTKDDAGLYILDGEYTPNTTGGGAYVQDYTWVRDDANGTHYHPLVSTAFPGDEHGNLPNDFNAYADYWYATFSYDLDPNGEGEYVKAYDNNYYTQETLPSYWASNYQDFKNNGTYNRTPLGYAQCANNEDVKNHKYDLFVVGDTYALWTSDVKDFVNGQKFARNPIAGEFREYNPSTDEGCDRYDITGNGFVLAVSPADDSKQHYTKSYVANSYREFDSSRDKSDEPLYCYGESDFVSDTPITYTKRNDYRGWHQFVLTGYAHNKNYDLVPYRSFITDNDWWTVCLPFDLTFADMCLFFGGGTDVPYLSKLTYVVRDVKNTKITLMFSKNLMRYKEVVSSPYVHGAISTEANRPADNEVVLHKGVPYLIRPNLTTQIVNGEEVITGTRQFDIRKDIYHSSDGDNCLYCRLEGAGKMSGRDQMQLVQNGIYTVPAFVINNEGSDAEDVLPNDDDETTTDVDESKFNITMENGPTFTYENGKLTHKGVEYDAQVSQKFTYSFIGSFYLSLMPQYSYFLGWDSQNNRAAFWYNEVDQKGAYTWNNNTGIICANWWKLPDLNPKDRRIHEATAVSDPARWAEQREGKWLSVVADSDNYPSMNQQYSKSYTMDFGGDMYNVDFDIPTEVQEIQNTESVISNGVYSTNGVYLGTSVKGLAKGLYIVNGKKYVVK